MEMNPESSVKLSIRLGESEAYTVGGSAGLLSQQLVSMKEQSMVILKDYITSHNAPADVPDDPLDGDEDDDDDDDDEVLVKPKSKKRK